MGFVNPDVFERVKVVESFLLWFQTAYSVWQFVRTAKFFRLPYVMVSSMWHGFDSWIKQRKLIMMRDELEVDKDYLASQDVELSTLPKGMAIVKVGEYNFEVSFDDDSYTCLTNRHRAAHMKQLRQSVSRDPEVKFGRDDDLLWPGLLLIRSLSFEHAMDHVLAGKGYDILPQPVCFFDYSTKELLNQNFVRFASIWPLILQARNFNFWSVCLSMVVILMDLLSYWANKIWKFVQYWISRLVKWSIFQASNRDTRVFLFTFMATISTLFYCENFVTDEASSKLVRQVLLATHMKFDKHKVAHLEPITCTKEVPRKERTENSSQYIEFEIHGVKYAVKAEPALSDREPSSVLFWKQNIKDGGSTNIKDGGWTMADMVYFVQVCDYCDKFKFPPLKVLDGKNAECCSFAEIVQGVKTRSFVLCEFKTAQRLFIT